MSNTFPLNDSDIHWCGCKRSHRGWPGSACKCPWCSEGRSGRCRYHNQWQSKQEHKELILQEWILKKKKKKKAIFHVINVTVLSKVNVGNSRRQTCTQAIDLTHSIESTNKNRRWIIIQYASVFEILWIDFHYKSADYFWMNPFACKMSEDHEKSPMWCLQGPCFV